VFANCIFCHADLGKNEAIEHFPVGRRLAFDGAKGRLWVVCKSCERWNLTPLEERWEAIEECERFYRDTKLRVSTDNIGLCRTRDGTDLVRIGEPRRPEMAAWRYGDQFGRRRRRHLVVGGLGIAAVGGYAIAGPLPVLIASLPTLLAWELTTYARMLLRRARTATVFIDDRGVRRRVCLDGVHRARFRPPEGEDVPALELRTEVLPGNDVKVRSFRLMKEEKHVLRGATVLRVLAQLLPHANASGGKRDEVQGAVRLLEAYADPRFIVRQAVLAKGQEENYTHPLLRSIGSMRRLALEMALHEEDERIAMEGELSALEERWREAEEIAAISDNMFLPDSVVETLRKLRRTD
jgi:hypothetical protein